MSAKRSKTSQPEPPAFFKTLREHWGVANSELVDSATFLLKDLDASVGEKLEDVARATWNKYLASAFSPTEEFLEESEGYGSKAYIETCRNSFSLREADAKKVSETEAVSTMLEGCDEEAVNAFNEAFDSSVDEVLVAEVGDEELSSGCVVVAKRNGLVFAWVCLQD